MNAKSKYQLSVVLALAALLANALTALAYPAEPFETAPSPSTFVPCRIVIEIAANVDIPSYRAEYEALNRIANCLMVAGAETTIPATGRPASLSERYLEMKARQAEQMDKSGATGSLPAAAVDESWMEFKTRQAERMDKSQ